MKISLVIPLRITDLVFEAEKRLKRIIATVPKDYFDILIVDYGTPREYIDILDNIQESNVRIITEPAKNKTFSIGHARDIGAQHSEHDIVIFHDIDFYGNDVMYQNIYAEVVSRDMQHRAFDFFCIPVFFLTEQGSNNFLARYQSNQIFNYQMQDQIINKAFDFVDFPAYGSSAIVVNKRHYLAIGGHSREFFGHGAEDYDILHRLSHYNPKGPRTANYYSDLKSNQINKFEGFRAFFALYGIDVFNKGIFFVHLFHPKRAISGYQQSNRNFTLLTDLMKNFDKTKQQPQALCDKTKKTNVLLLMKADSSVVKGLRHLLPVLGHYNILDEALFKSEEHLLKYIQHNDIDTVGLLNPYGNAHRLKIYNMLKRQGCDYFVFDRGALPNSWFFDKGFNFDSASYDEENWHGALDEEKKSSTLDYMYQLMNSEETLESNGVRKTALYLKEKYHIGNRKVLFIPFQRPNDSVIKHFSGHVGSMDNFYDWVEYISEQLDPTEWVILCKKHPLENNIPQFNHAIEVEEDTHIHDLLELADKVFLINSGVGLLSLIYNKPVICAGNAFYAKTGLAFSAENKQQSLDLILSDEKPCHESITKFIHYLVNDFYSFGDAKYTHVVKETSSLTIVNEILFNNINIFGQKYLYGKPRLGISLDAPLFETFGGRVGIKMTSDKSKKQVVKKPTVVAKVATTPVVALHKKPKVKKLIKHPYLFFRDMLIKRLRTQSISTASTL